MRYIDDHWVNKSGYSDGISKCVWEIGNKTTKFSAQRVSFSVVNYSRCGGKWSFKHALCICRIKISYIQLQISWKKQKEDIRKVWESHQTAGKVWEFIERKWNSETEIVTMTTVDIQAVLTFMIVKDKISHME